MTTPKLHPTHSNCIDSWLHYLWLQRSFSDHSLEAYRSDLTQFCLWLESGEPIKLGECMEWAPADPADGFLTQVTPEHLHAWLLAQLESSKAPASVARGLAAVRNFFQWFSRSRAEFENPCHQLKGIHQPHQLPKVLSQEEISRLIDSIDLSQPLGVRDRS
ncbi:MAG: tyrosine-type recombinase/integrase, partial [Gammaproteobacteria bacterium]